MTPLRSMIKQFILKNVVQNSRMRDYFEYSMSEKDVLFFRQFDDHALIYHPHDIIGKLLTQEGAYSREPVRQLAQYLPGLKGDSWIIELGGNIGTHTVYFCREFGTVNVLSVEADPENVEILEKNVKLNDLGHRVKVVSGAVSNFDGRLELVRDFYNRGGTSVGGDVAADRSTVFSTIAMTTDTLVKEQGLAPEKIGLIWIDVEGHELEVLEGMEATLQLAPPLFFEYSPGDSVRNGRIADAVFNRYTAVWIWDGGLQKISREDFLKISGGADIFAMNP